ncbi:hypothetical protein GPALN_003713 [Globodera pallida]|uniref:Uncharacterized protein n=1 Tax=Globodera pallida TaxID=36090 RepID=A0A183BLT5_GLOPA|nr:hypothetical protein GPALN_003713 [Globodera pallida]
MDESTSDNSPLNLLDSSNSRASVSTLERPNNETVEKLSRCLREFESENLELKRAIPRLKDAKGDDITEWAIKIINELEEERRKHNETQQNLAMLTHRFREFRDDAAEKAQKGAKTIDDLRRQAEEYEEENQRIRDQLRDDQSQIFNLRRRLDDVPEHADGGRQSPEENSDENLRACLEHFDRRSDTEEQESGQSTQRRLRHQLQQSLNIISFLFEKHRSLANSVGHLLSSHGNTQDVSLLGKINDMKLDLNQSMEICKRKFEELQSAPTSAESSIHESIDRAEPLAKNCTKCKLLENERDALKVQLNNEIKSKERFLEKGEIAERNLREARRSIEELGGELRASLAKAEQIEEIERRMKECQEECRNKDERFKKKSKELREVAGHTCTLRQQNLALDSKNENILNAVQRLKEIHADEVNAKDIEVQRQYASVEYLEQRCRELEEQFMNEKERSKSLEKEAQKKEELVKKYSTKTKAFRRLLMQYGHYLDSSMEYETLVERSNRILQDKISDGQRSCSSSSNQPTIHQQNPSAHRHNGKRE